MKKVSDRGTEADFMSVVFNKDLVILDVEVQDNFDALGLIADNFRRLGFVKATYKDAVIAREKIFATGLPTVTDIGVAIPHTDIEHVHTAAISFTRLKEPVEFTVMGDENSKVAVKLVFMLALREAHAQIEMLQALMAIIQDEKALNFLATEANVSKICKFVQKRLPNIA